MYRAKVVGALTREDTVHFTEYTANFILTGATRTPSGQELLLARQQTVLIAKAYRLQAIDMVHINFKGYPLYRSFE